ncbi:hypothetical protein MBLNU230_g7189t1 [Neophaeotheca triangularis]
MAPKKSTAAGATSKPKAAPAHSSYQDMIKEAIINLKERNGSSRQAIKKYVQANNDLSASTENQFTSQFNKALQKGGDSGVFARPKGPSGPVKLAKPADKAATKTESTTTKTKAPAKAKATKAAAAEKPEKAEKAEKKPATKKVTKTTTTTKKAPATKKTTTKTTKTAANTGKARKTAKAPTSVGHRRPIPSHWMWIVNDGYRIPLPEFMIASLVTKELFTCQEEYEEYMSKRSLTHFTVPQAPAVEEKTAVVLGKTKSGRVTKSNAPQPAAAPKKAAVKKTTTKTKA